MRDGGGQDDAGAGERTKRRGLPLTHRRRREQDVGQIQNPERAADAAADGGRARHRRHDAQQQQRPVGRDPATDVGAEPVQRGQRGEQERVDDGERLPGEEGVEVQPDAAVVVLLEHDGADQGQCDAAPGRDRGDPRQPFGEVHVSPCLLEVGLLEVGLLEVGLLGVTDSSTSGHRAVGPPPEVAARCRRVQPERRARGSSSRRRSTA